LYAQEVALQKQIGSWSVYCIKGVVSPQPQDCSVVTAVVSDSDAAAWIRLGFYLRSSKSGSEPTVSLKIKTPRLDFFKNGISIGLDGRHIGQAFIETCDKKSCETTVSVDAELRQDLITAKLATFEYQINSAESVSLAVSVEQLPIALAELAKNVGLSEPVVAKKGNSPDGNVLVYHVQLRTNPYLFTSSMEADTNNWGDPVGVCDGVPASKEVKVAIKNLKIQNNMQLATWLDATKHCSNGSIFWVTQGVVQQPENSITTDAGLHAVYDAVRDKVPEAVVSGADGVPLRPFK
jgi:invasion protein IalB